MSTRARLATAHHLRPRAALPLARPRSAVSAGRRPRAGRPRAAIRRTAGAPAAAGGRRLRGPAGGRLAAAGRLLHLALLDPAAPRAALVVLHEHMRLEAGKIGAHRTLDVTHAAGGLLDQGAGLDVDVHLDTREARSELVERHNACVGDPFGHLPLDPLVWPLLDDLRLELLRNAPDLRLEGEVRLVLLRDVLEPVHEARPLLELGPLVVDRPERGADVDVLLDRHPPTLADTRLTLGLGAAAGLADGVLDGAANLVADLLDGPGAIAAQSPDQLAGAFCRERRRHREPYARCKSLRSRQPAVRAPAHVRRNRLHSLTGDLA